MTRVPCLRAALAGFGSLLAVGACGSDDTAPDDPCEAVAEPLALMSPAAAQVMAFTQRLRADLYVDCARLVTALGGGKQAARSAPSDAQVEAMCADARQRVDDASPADFLLAVSRAHCRVDHEQQFACERACQQSASCDPGTVETRCPDLAVSGLCSAACPATCEGSPAMPTNCEGKCFGACLGSCVGPRRGDICEGSCLGLCGGDCTLPESTTAPCSDGVRCLSRCAGAWSELACESPLLGSPCGASGYCFAACGVVGAFGATCEPASIASEGLPAALDDAIALSYPRLLSLPSYELLYVDPALLLVAAYDVLRADHPDADHCPATPRATLKDEREQLAAAAASLLCLTSELRAAPCF